MIALIIIGTLLLSLIAIWTVSWVLPLSFAGLMAYEAIHNSLAHNWWMTLWFLALFGIWDYLTVEAIEQRLRSLSKQERKEHG